MDVCAKCFTKAHLPVRAVVAPKSPAANYVKAIDGPN
jgi:hypothetical protein